MQSIYWLEKVLKMISLYVNALLCTLQHIVIQFGELYDIVLQPAQKSIDVQGDHFQHLL